MLKALCLVLPFSANAQSKIRSHRDTLSLSQCEFVIGNASRQVKGFLYNAGNGKTAFYAIGKAVQFTAGSSGAPAAGVAAYTNAAFVHRRIKVWRNGLLQPVANENGIDFNPTTGTIVFFPPLAHDDRILIESFSITEL